MDKQIGSGLTAQTWPRITIENVTVNGNTIEVYTTTGLFVGQKLILRKNGLFSTELVIARVWDARFITVKLENNQDLSSLNLAQFTGGMLDAPEQARVYPVGTEPGKMTLAEEPILAVRSALVSQHGNYLTTQEGSLDTDYPEARFIYDCQYNLREIREFVRDQSKGYLGSMRLCDVPAGIAIFTTPLPFMASNPSSLYYYETLGDGSPVNETTYTITGFNDYENTYLTQSGDVIFSANTVYFNAPAPEYLVAKKAKYFQMAATGVNDNIIHQIVSGDYGTFNQSADQVVVNSGLGTMVFKTVPEWLKVIGRKIKVINGLNAGLTLTTTNYNVSQKKVTFTGLTASETIDLKFSIYNSIVIGDTFSVGQSTGYLDSRFAFISVVPGPAATVTVTANLNGSLGDKVKSTNFSYGCALEITRISTTYSDVDGADIYTGDTNPC